MTESDLVAIGLLQDPARRSLYEYVVAQGREVSRNEAAEAVGVGRTLAAFHLDQLATGGLLDVAFRRLTGRSGPGAGRPAKLYIRAATEHAVSVPQRDYARAARIFAETIERSGTETTLYRAAHEQGAAAARTLGQATGSSRLSLDDVQCYLEERGYEPYRHASRLQLRNCPFRSVAREFPAVMCGMNLALVEGMLDGGELAQTHTARLEPQPGECCVVICSKTNDD